MTKIGQETRNAMVLLKKVIFDLESVFSIFKNLFLFPKPLQNAENTDFGTMLRL